jgi:hypothetical protein
MLLDPTAAPAGFGRNALARRSNGTQISRANDFAVALVFANPSFD